MSSVNYSTCIKRVSSHNVTLKKIITIMIITDNYMY